MRLLTILLLLPFIVRSSALDSIEQLIPKASGKVRNELLAHKYKIIADTFAVHKQTDSAISVLNQAISYAEQGNNIMLLAKCYNNLGRQYGQKGKHIESLLHYNKSLNIIREYGDINELSTALLNIGIAYKELGIYDRALQLLIEAEKLSQRLENRTRLSGVYNAMANVYNHLENSTKALEYHTKAIEILKTLNEPPRLSGSLNNIAQVYTKLNKYDSALYFLRQSLSLKRKGKYRGIDNTLSNMGEAYLGQNDLKEAQRFFEEAYRLRINEKHEEGIVHSYIDLGNLALKQKNYKKAEYYMLKGVLLAHKIKTLQHEVRLYEMLKDLYIITGELTKAIEYFTLYTKSQGQLLGDKKQARVQSLEIQFDAYKQEQENQILNQQAKIRETTLRLQEEELKARNIINISLTIGSIILGILAAISYYAFLLKKKTAQQKETHMRELHHRVKNNLQIVSGLLSLQSAKLTDPEAKEAVKESENRVQAMAFIHRKLYNETEVSRMNMQEYISELVFYLSDAYGYAHERTKLSIEPVFVDIEQAIPIGLIINELVSNVFKYAFPDDPSASLSVSLHKNNETLHLIVQDNGTSPIADSNTDSFGLKLVKSLCKQLKAKLDFTSDHGFKYAIIIE